MKCQHCVTRKTIRITSMEVSGLDNIINKPHEYIMYIHTIAVKTNLLINVFLMNFCSLLCSVGHNIVGGTVGLHHHT